MKRTCLIFTACLISMTCANSATPAQVVKPVKIYVQSMEKPIRGVIASESVDGVRLKTKAETIPANKIVDIDYAEHIDQTGTRILYSAAVTAEKEAEKTSDKTKRDKLLNEAINKFQQAKAKMPKTLFAAHRHVQYKLAHLHGLLGIGSEGVLKRVQAVKMLNEYKKENPDSWQIPHVLTMLIRLHADGNDFAKAQKVLAELNASKVSDSAKQEAAFVIVRLMMDDAKALRNQKQIAEAQKMFTEAQKQIEALLPKLPKDDPLRLKAVLARAQCKAADPKQKDAATKELESLLSTIEEKQLRPIVYNTLGELYYADGRLHDARWKFLWVDVIYNQDKEEHARALYYLWKTFNQLNEPERGQEFFATLTSNTRFDGTFYRQKALKENEAAQ